MAKRYAELESEVDSLLNQIGVEAFQTECLRPVSNLVMNEDYFQEPPYYEVYGEKQVAAGHYERVLRYREHFLPLAEALQQHAGFTSW